MPTDLTPEQILALAPDSGVGQSGRGLSNLRKWGGLGQSATAVWGECQGSGKVPYKVQIDLCEPAFRCTCPSHKFPCKHGIGLLLLLAAQPASIPESAQPDWVAEWLAKREQNAQRKSEKTQSDTAAPEPKRRAATQEQRAAAREASVSAGLDELTQWLHDLLRQGLATCQSRGPGIWDAMASRMVDAQAPGVARMLRDMAGVAASGEGWQSRLLERLARLHLLIEGYKRREHLPPNLLAEVRTRIGWAQDQESVRAKPGLRDRWLALGQSIEEEEQLRVQRIWLWGLEARRPALLLAFAAPGQHLERSVIIGTMLDAELAYFDGAFPLRALIAQRHATPVPPTHPPGYATLNDAIGAYTAALAQNPWLDRFPLPLQEVTPLCEGGRWYICDREGRAMPLLVRGLQSWRLVAISGGRPLALFGTWDGNALTPLSAWSGEQVLGIEA
jgi:hypothetical protein